WDAFFYGTGVLDIAVDGVTMRQADGQTRAEVRLRRVGSIPFPVTMRLKLNDGLSQDVRLPVEIWTHTDRYTAPIPEPRAVVGVRLGPAPNVPDGNSANNIWGSAPAADAATASTAGGTAPPIPGSSTAAPAVAPIRPPTK